MITTGDQFLTLQQYLLGIYWPFIEFWIMAFIVAGILLAIFIVFLVVSRELLTPTAI